MVFVLRLKKNLTELKIQLLSRFGPQQKNCHGYAYLSRCREIEKVFELITHPFFNTTRSPYIFFCPAYILFQIDYHTLLFPIKKICRRKGFDISSRPIGKTITGGIEVKMNVFMRKNNIRISLISIQYRIVINGCMHLPFFCWLPLYGNRIFNQPHGKFLRCSKLYFNTCKQAKQRLQ